MPETDQALAQATELARAALDDVAPEGAVGEALGTAVEAEGTLSLRFQCLLPGYPGWRWVATLARVGDAEPTVLETELLPSEDALLAPDWVPWSERLAEYQAAQSALAEAGGGEDSAEDDGDGQEVDDLDDADDVDDVDEYDDDHDLDDEINGVDIDELAGAEEAEEDAADAPAVPGAP